MKYLSDVFEERYRFVKEKFILENEILMEIKYVFWYDGKEYSE